MKAGIITYYYNSVNYGAILQSYALCRQLNEMGIEAYQICYDGKRNMPFSFSGVKRIRHAFRPYLGWAADIYRSKSHTPKEKAALTGINIRNRAIHRFASTSIPHTEKVYGPGSLRHSKMDLDIYIAGSDQIWQPGAVSGAYLLDFVPAQVPKISYAASITAKQLPPLIQEHFQRSLPQFRAVSVREKEAVPLLQGLYNKEIKWVLDPVLLLGPEIWDEVASSRGEEKKYVFAYFLGESREQRELAKAFARKKGLPLVTFPHLCKYQPCDDDFGDEQVFDAGPEDFIALIKNTDYVLTDSFHACVFSLLYQKEFYAFDRIPDKVGMSGRITDLLELFNVPERFCDTPEKMTMSYIASVPAIDYTQPHQRYTNMRAESNRFLQENLFRA